MNSGSPWIWSGVLIAAVLAGCGAPQPVPVEEPVDAAPPPPSPEELCEDFEQRLIAIWSPAARADLDLQVHVYEDTLDASDAEKAVAWLDVMARAWVRGYDATCKDMLLAQVIAEEEFRERSDCLESVLEQLRSTVPYLVNSGETAVERAKSMVTELERCIPEDAGRPDIRENPF